MQGVHCLHGLCLDVDGSSGEHDGRAVVGRGGGGGSGGGGGQDDGGRVSESGGRVCGGDGGQQGVRAGRAALQVLWLGGRGSSLDQLGGLSQLQVTGWGLEDSLCVWNIEKISVKYRHSL